MSSAAHFHADRVVEYLRKERKGEFSLEEVMRLAEVMTQSFQSAFHAVDQEVYAELGDMAREIAAMKGELSALKLADMRRDRIPQAGRELEAIVEATEEATNTIMNAAEAIMGADPSDPDAFQATVNDKVIEIFEACSFQDITGQRISKVVTTLGHIDQRIGALIDRMRMIGSQDDSGPEGEESAAERRARELILHGPQHKGEGVSQTDVDEHFS